MISKFWIGPLAVVAAAVTLGGCRPVEETRFVNFDAETSAGVLTSGWSGYEKTVENDSFVWSTARSATLTVSCRARGDQLVRFRCWPFRFPGAQPQTATLFVNGNRIESVGLADGSRVYSFATPEALWKPGANEIRFEFAYAEAPRDRLPGNGDPRTLSAAFDWLEIVPSKPPDKKG